MGPRSDERGYVWAGDAFEQQNHGNKIITPRRRETMILLAMILKPSS